MIKDYFSGIKYIGKFVVLSKEKRLGKYYIKTTEPNFNLIKVDAKSFAKIPINKKVDLVTSRSKRVYKYNPLIKNPENNNLI